MKTNFGIGDFVVKRYDEQGIHREVYARVLSDDEIRALGVDAMIALLNKRNMFVLRTLDGGENFIAQFEPQSFVGNDDPRVDSYIEWDQPEAA
jgi:hypothetical protein